MNQMRHVATYVCDANPRRSKTFPFAEGQTPPKALTCEITGDTFTLREVKYEADMAQIEQTQRRIREWNATLFGSPNVTEAA